jgi:UDP-N-acetylglucosamine--N-acetylmuramyl-(pentapeptide) pyrophosphoryl-undecaprenol N-acetylglucosamine transferase
MRVAIAGGGTAGHVNPALALAMALEGSQSFFVGTERGVESQLVPAGGFELETIDVAGFDRARPWSLVPTGWRAVRAVRQAVRVLRRLRPQVVVGMGGYVSLPVCFAAATMRIPVLLHEQNIVLGLANKVCKPLARKIAVSFPETMRAAGDKAVDTGNPVLPHIAQLNISEARARGYGVFDLDPALKTILIFGGSLGAARINAAGAGLPARWHDRSDLQVLHITGRSAYEKIRESAASTSGLLRYRALPYVEDMGAAYAVADLALCRGGATTVAELTVIGVPAIIVPYPHHRDRQQELHAEALESAGAAKVLTDADTTTDSTATLIDSLISDPEALESMRNRASAYGRPRAAEALAALVRQVAGS